MKSPIKPTGFRVVVRQDQIEEKSKGGIITATSKEINRKQVGQIEGTLVAIGASAFTGEDFGDEDREILKPGTKVIYARYAGDTYRYKDEDSDTSPLYHLCSDMDIKGIPEDGVVMARDGS